MTKLLRFYNPLIVAAVLAAAVWVPASAETPLPVVPKAKGEQCVEPTDYMRRQHMTLLMHQRDDTMRRGIRTRKHSLAECINCHVQPDSSGKYPEIGTKDHFCGACHAYAAVHIDCFQCHRSTPEGAQSTSQEGPAHGQ